MAVTINGSGVVTGLDSEGSSDLGSKLEAAGGLVMVTPTTIANSGGTATLTNGAVAFSGVSSVSLNGCFTSDYQNYVVTTNITTSANAGMLMRLRVTGTDNTTANYGVGYRYSLTTGSNAGDASSGGQTAWNFHISNLCRAANMNLFIQNPQKTDYTTVGFNNLMSDNAVSSFYSFTGGASFIDTTGFDGFTLYPSSGTISGTIRVYGYRNGI